MLTELREQFEYNHWANERVLDACTPLTAEQLNRELGGSFPSVWKTFSHIYGAENSWFGRWQGTPIGRPSDLGAVNDVLGLRQKWAALWQTQSRWLAGLTEGDVRQVLPVQFRDGTSFQQQLGATMRHCMNHSTYHRGQIINFLRMLGAQPVGTDLVTYYMDHPPA